MVARVRLRLFATPREIVGERELTLAVPDGTTAQGVIEILLARHPELAPHVPRLVVSINQEIARRDDRVSDGDEVALLPPMSGGGESEVDARFDELVPPLDELVRRVGDSRAGAIVTFVGVVRAESEGAPVVELEYEIYEGMAQRELLRLCTEAKTKFGLCRVAAVHAEGRFKPQQPTVAIAVSAPHREAAFAGCAYVIEELKRRVPIWKKESTGKGGVVERARWVDGHA